MRLAGENEGREVCAFSFLMLTSELGIKARPKHGGVSVQKQSFMRLALPKSPAASAELRSTFRQHPEF